MEQKWTNNIPEVILSQMFPENHYVENHISEDKNGHFWWWDETESDGYGPFDSLEKCRKSMADYCKTL